MYRLLALVASLVVLASCAAADQQQTAPPPTSDATVDGEPDNEMAPTVVPDSVAFDETSDRSTDPSLLAHAETADGHAGGQFEAFFASEVGFGKNLSVTGTWWRTQDGDLWTTTTLDVDLVQTELDRLAAHLERNGTSGSLLVGDPQPNPHLQLTLGDLLYGAGLVPGLAGHDTWLDDNGPFTVFTLLEPDADTTALEEGYPDGLGWIQRCYTARADADLAVAAALRDMELDFVPTTEGRQLAELPASIFDIAHEHEVLVNEGCTDMFENLLEETLDPVSPDAETPTVTIERWSDADGEHLALTHVRYSDINFPMVVVTLRADDSVSMPEDFDPAPILAIDHWYMAKIGECGALPWQQRTFMASYDEISPDDAAYAGPALLDPGGWFCG